MKVEVGCRNDVGRKEDWRWKEEDVGKDDSPEGVANDVLGRKQFVRKEVKDWCQQG